MYKKIIFYIQVAILLVFAKNTLQAQAFDFVYIDSVSTEPYLNNVSTLFNWYALESDFIDIYEVEKSTNLIDWQLLERKPNNILYNSQNQRVTYRSFDRMAATNSIDTIWYRVKAISKLGYYLYDAPAVSHKPLEQHMSVHPYITDKKILKYYFQAAEIAENIELILIDPVSLKSYVFEKPLEKGFHKIPIPASWNLEKGAYILKVNYTAASPWLNSYHQVLIL